MCATESCHRLNSPAVATPSLTLRYCLLEVSLRPEEEREHARPEVDVFFEGAKTKEQYQKKIVFPSVLQLC